VTQPETTRRRWPMRPIWRWSLFSLAPLGALAVLWALVRLLDLPVPILAEQPGSIAEAWVALAAGAGMAVFALSAMPNARLELTDSEIRHLAFGIRCGTGRIPLDGVRRFGVGVESRGYRRHRILLLDGADGRVRSVKLSMYEDADGFLRALGERLGKEPSPTRDSLMGVVFDDG